MFLEYHPWSCIIATLDLEQVSQLCDSWGSSSNVCRVCWFLQQALDFGDEFCKPFCSGRPRHGEVGEKFNGFRVPGAMVVRDVTNMISVVVGGWTQVISVNSMIIECRSLLWRLIHYDLAPRWC